MMVSFSLLFYYRCKLHSFFVKYAHCDPSNHWSYENIDFYNWLTIFQENSELAKHLMTRTQTRYYLTPTALQIPPIFVITPQLNALKNKQLEYFIRSLTENSELDFVMIVKKCKLDTVGSS